MKPSTRMVLMDQLVTLSFTPFTLRTKNYLGRDLDCNLDSNIARDPDDVPVYTGHPLCNSTKRRHHIIVHCSVVVTLQST